MNKNDFIIRLERKDEQRKTENLVRDAFWNVYRPGCLEHYVLNCLREDPGFVPRLNFVMEKDGELIGQTISVKAVIDCDDGRKLPILTMGPICIHPDFQKQGLGKALLDYSLEKAAEMGFGAVCFEGNIDFYKNSGFTFARDFGIRYHGLPEGMDSSFFLGKELIKGYFDFVSGEYSTPQGYFVNEDETEEFDKNFPPKEKANSESQIF